MNGELLTSPLDEQFASLLLRLNGAPDPTLEHAARTVSAWRAEGHICVPLSALGETASRERLLASRVVGQPGEFKPLILDRSDRLYLQRYWQYEAELAASLQRRLEQPVTFDARLLAAGLKRYFDAPADAIDLQRIAAETAVRKAVCVISGGPGTGKTRTVVAVLALLHEQFAARGAAPRIALAAPTGKAAARMKESIQAAVEGSPEFAELRGKLPTEAATLHRLLGSIPGSPYFRHHADRPLAVDAVIVDEASMIDLALMAKLIAAIPATARLILLGDRDQLASVEAGSVLGDICNTAGEAGAKVRMAEHIVELRKNYRFQQDSGIHRMSQLINRGDAEESLRLLQSGDASDVRLRTNPTPPELAGALHQLVVPGYSPFLTEPKPLEALQRLSDFRVLCAVRRGPSGVDNLNRLIEQALVEEGLIQPGATHYHGRPVLVQVNDYGLRLFNGDVGLILRDPDSADELRAFFPDGAGGLRRLLPARLPLHETTFAMTVHKSQGSEFERILFVLPEADAPLLTRELVYTAVTRARSSVEIWANPGVLQTAIERRTVRASGLREALWGQASAAVD